ncbi:MAG: RidA family protein [Promethearchaeota archaeon]
MKDIKYINPKTPVAGPYTPGVLAGNILFISGQGPKQSINTIEEQTYSTLENIKSIVEATGGKMANVVNITVFLSEIEDFSKMNKSYRQFFDDNNMSGKYPARTTVEVSNLPLAGMLIEINAIAVL